MLADVQPGPRIPRSPYTTTVLYRCADCEWVESAQIDGSWKLKDLYAPYKIDHGPEQPSAGPEENDGA